MKPYRLLLPALAPAVRAGVRLPREVRVSARESLRTAPPRDKVPVRFEELDFPLAAVPLPLRFDHDPTGDFPLRDVPEEWALPLAERSDRQRQLRQAVDAAKEALVRDGDGLSQAAVEAEVAEQDIADVPAHLEAVKQSLGDVGKRLNTLAQQQVVAQQAFGAIDGQASAAVAEAKRQEALAAMGDAAEQYLEAATASRLLKWATDRYRDQKQGPMLRRAGEIFAGLTLGEFSRLTVDTERTPPALYARRTKGTSVEVAGLSEGTRDQLFLALRIAALELQLASRTALPFVADDLFINFDDARAKAGLEALRDLSTRTQVLFLTHHDHLLPLVRDVFGAQVNVVALQREVAGA